MQENKPIANDGTKRLRILEVIDNYFPTIDGVVRVVDSYAENLNEKADCTVFAPWYPGSPKINKYKLILSPSISGGKYGVRLPVPYFSFKLRKFFKNNKFDIIHCHSPVTLAGYIVKYAKKNNIPLVFTLHTRFHEEINAHVKIKFLQKFALNFLLRNMRKMEYFWTVSDSGRELLNDVYNIKSDCKIMRNGAHMCEETANKDIVEKIKREYDLAKCDVVLLDVGRLVKVKNYDLIFETVSILKNKGYSVKVFIVGDGDYRNELISHVAEYNLSNEVILTGYVGDEETLASYYLASDMFVLPSTFDTSSLVVRDAYAMSLPVLTVKNSAAAEGIIDNHNGFIAECNSTAFAEKIEYVIANKKILSDIAKNSKKELYLSWSQITDEVLKEYQEIVSSRRVLRDREK